MKKVLITIISMLLPLMASAWTSAWGTNVNGIYYLFDSSQKTATVTCEYVIYWNGGKIDDWKKADYSGAIDIPSEVTYNEETYEVTAIGDVAFAGTDITSVSIPESVVSIGNRAFYECI